jgi:hypothetical protein
VGRGERRDPETEEEGAGEESPRGRHGVGCGGEWGTKPWLGSALGWLGLGGEAVETTGLWVRFVFGLEAVETTGLWVRFVFGLESVFFLLKDVYVHSLHKAKIFFISKRRE